MFWVIFFNLIKRLIYLSYWFVADYLIEIKLHLMCVFNERRLDVIVNAEDFKFHLESNYILSISDFTWRYHHLNCNSFQFVIILKPH